MDRLTSLRKFHITSTFKTIAEGGLLRVKVPKALAKAVVKAVAKVAHAVHRAKFPKDASKSSAVQREPHVLLKTLKAL